MAGGLEGLHRRETILHVINGMGSQETPSENYKFKNLHRIKMTLLIENINKYVSNKFLKAFVKIID